MKCRFKLNPETVTKIKDPLGAIEGAIANCGISVNSKKTDPGIVEEFSITLTETWPVRDSCCKVK